MGLLPQVWPQARWGSLQASKITISITHYLIISYIIIQIHIVCGDILSKHTPADDRDNDEIASGYPHKHDDQFPEHEDRLSPHPQYSGQREVVDEDRDGDAALPGIAPPHPAQKHQEHAEHGNAELDVEFSSISLSETPVKNIHTQIYKQVLGMFIFIKTYGTVQYCAIGEINYYLSEIWCTLTNKYSFPEIFVKQLLHM